MLIKNYISTHRAKTSFEGEKSIKGVVTKQGIPAISVVRCYEKASGIMVCQTISTKSGKYRIPNLSKAYRYLITSFDPYSQFNAVIQDNVVPK